MASNGWMLLPAVALVVAAAGATALFSSAGPVARGEPKLMGVNEVDVGDGYVRIKGMAHYQSKISQKVPGGLFGEDRTWFVYGLFEPLDSSSRAVRVLVRTQKKPDDLAALELMEVEGWIGQPVPSKIPPSTEALLSKRTDYYFADDVMLLQATRIYSEDGVWEEP